MEFVNVGTNCRPWRGALTHDGYGLYTPSGKDAKEKGLKMRAAHVVLWEFQNGPVPEGKELDHTCRLRNCVNPAHLEAVTHKENIWRGRAKAFCRKGHRLAETRRVYKNGRSVCGVCDDAKKTAKATS